MNALLRISGTWRPFIVLSAWFYVLTAILHDGSFRDFLRPEFGVVLWLAAACCCALIAAGIAKPETRPLGLQETVRALLLLVPLGFLLMARGTTLTADAFRQRDVGFGRFRAAAATLPAPSDSGMSGVGLSMPMHGSDELPLRAEDEPVASGSSAAAAPGNGSAPSVPPSADAAASLPAPTAARIAVLPDPDAPASAVALAPTPAAPARPVTPAPSTTPTKPTGATPTALTARTVTLPTPPQGAAIAATILQLYEKPEWFEGKRVHLVGMVRRDAKTTGQFGADHFLLFRFAISCCVADAVPVAVVLEGATDQPENTWVEVEGTFGILTKGDARFPLLSAVRIIPTTEPEAPYL